MKINITLFKHSPFLLAGLVMLTSFIYLGNFDPVMNVALFVAAVACVTLIANIPVRFMKAVAPVLYCVSLIFLVLTTILPDTLSLQGFESVSIEPRWLVSISLILTLPTIIVNDGLKKTHKEIYVMTTTFLLLSLLATKDLMFSIVLGFSVTVAVYICGIARKKVNVILFLFVLCYGMVLGGIMLFGKTHTEISNEVLVERSQTLQRVDHWKEIMILGTQQENVDLVQPDQLAFLPVALGCLVLFLTARKLRDSKQFLKLTAVAAACAVITIAFGSAMERMVSGSTIITVSILYGIIMSCLHENKTKEI